MKEDPQIRKIEFKNQKSKIENQKLNIEPEHPAPFPKTIVILPVLQTSREQDLVLDPFVGSGTTAKVCKVLNRNFVGYDTVSYY